MVCCLQPNSPSCATGWHYNMGPSARHTPHYFTHHVDGANVLRRLQLPPHRLPSASFVRPHLWPRRSSPTLVFCFSTESPRRVYLRRPPRHSLLAAAARVDVPPRGVLPCTTRSLRWTLVSRPPPPRSSCVAVHWSNSPSALPSSPPHIRRRPSVVLRTTSVCPSCAGMDWECVLSRTLRPRRKCCRLRSRPHRHHRLLAHGAVAASKSRPTATTAAASVRFARPHYRRVPSHCRAPTVAHCSGLREVQDTEGQGSSPPSSLF